MSTEPTLRVVMYHYIRNPPNSEFPKLKAMLLSDFRQQVLELSACYEMATLESAMRFLRREYRPKRDLCLLTFDDGLKEHYDQVTNVLADQKIQGVFSLITSCLEEMRVAPVHMNHLLMASLDFDTYRAAFTQRLAEKRQRIFADVELEAAAAASTYPWDSVEVAVFKYFFNFVLEPDVRDEVVRELFERYIGPEQELSARLYLNWQQARQMQAAGMAIGGHSHQHRPLAGFASADLGDELAACRTLLELRLRPQPCWPFCYPYGKCESFHKGVITELQRLHFACSFTTVAGDNQPGADLFAIRRVDCKRAFEPVRVDRAAV